MRTSDSNILIIVPKLSSGICMEINLMPTGLACISSVVKQKGYKVDILNLNLSVAEENHQIQEMLSDRKYRFVLSGGLSPNYSAVKNCVDLVRAYDPSAKIILGGGLITTEPEVMLEALRPDFIVIGEGEQTIVELLEYLTNHDGIDGDIAQIDGIGYISHKNEVILTNPRRYIEDLDSLPFPDYQGVGLETMLENSKSKSYVTDIADYPIPYLISASRSCPYQCTFCFHTDKYRQRSVANVMEEISFAVDRYKINLILLYDELLSQKKERVYDFCKRIGQLNHSVPWEIHWICQMRVDALDEDLIATMKDAGCHSISLGLESYSPVVLKSMKKRITPEQIDHALRICSRHNMTVQGNFIFGDVAETLETAHETLEYWTTTHELVGDAISLFFINLYPGCQLYKYACDKGIIQDKVDFVENHVFDQVYITQAMTLQEFKRLNIEIYLFSAKYNRVHKPLAVKEIDGVPEVHGKCPYCNAVSVYKNYYIQPRRGNNMRCRNCGKRYNIGFTIAIWRKKVGYMLLKMIGITNFDRLMTLVGFVQKQLNLNFIARFPVFIGRDQE